MASAGAADGDGEITPAVAVEARQPFLDEPPDVREHFLYAGIGFAKLDHGRVAPGVRAQLGIVMRVGEAAHVEHHVGVERHAVFVGERLEEKRESGGGDLHEIAHPCAQQVRR